MFGNSEELAQTKTGKITAKELLKVVKHGTSWLALRGTEVYGRPSYSDAWTFSVEAKKETKGVATRLSIEVPGRVANGNTSAVETLNGLDQRPYTRYSDAFKPSTGYWSLYAKDEALRDILELLPSDAEVAFEVALDWYTTPLHINATVRHPGQPEEKGLHEDVLYLKARYTQRGKVREVRFLLDVHTSLHNSARFGYPSRF